MIQIVILLGIGAVRCQHMTLCDYYEKLGVAKAECGHIIKPLQDSQFLQFPNQFSNIITKPSIKSNNQFFRFNTYSNNYPINTFSSLGNELAGHLPLCRNYFHSCMRSTACESGTICTNGVEQGSCCTNPNRASCPSISAMSISCRKTRAVNWCNSDADCRGSSTTASMCCPTGCNYNMCVHVGVQNIHPRRSIVFNSFAMADDPNQCPDPYQLDIKCVSTKGANWCYTDGDCVSGLYIRKCCATNCGYNTCVMKFNNKWIVA